MPPPRRFRARRRYRPPARGAEVAPLLGLALGASLGLAGLVAGDLGIVFLGSVLAWIAVGPIGCAWLAAHQGREAAAWFLFAIVAPGMAFLVLLVAGPRRQR